MEILLSVIIPTCNRSELLKKCLHQLRTGSQTLNEKYYEIIITDDSCDNKQTKRLVETQFGDCKWVEGPKCGPAANRNNGAKWALGEWIVFVDDDCLPSNSLLQSYKEAIFLYKDSNVFEGRIKVDRPRKSFTEESPINETGGYLWSCNFSIRKQLFFDVEGFNIGFPFPAVEDAEFNYRLRKLGQIPIFVKRAYVIHPWRDQKELFHVTIKRFKSILYFLRIHPEQSKNINFAYYLKISLKRLTTLPKGIIDYKFKGLGGEIIFIFLHFCFAFIVLFRRKNKVGQLN